MRSRIGIVALGLALGGMGCRSDSDDHNKSFVAPTAQMIAVLARNDAIANCRARAEASLTSLGGQTLEERVFGVGGISTSQALIARISGNANSGGRSRYSILLTPGFGAQESEASGALFADPTGNDAPAIKQFSGWLLMWGFRPRFYYEWAPGGIIAAEIGDGKIGVQSINDSMVRVFFPNDGTPNNEVLVLNISECGDSFRHDLPEGYCLEVNRSAQGICSAVNQIEIPTTGGIFVHWRDVNALAGLPP